MDWIFEYASPDQAAEVMAATGAIIAGRRTYEVGQRDTGKPCGEAYGGAWQGAQFVLTHQPPQAPPDPAVTFLSGDIEAAVATARKAADGKNVEVFGADLTGQCLERGLVDEIVVHIAPVLLGTGTPFPPPSTPPGLTWNPSAAPTRAQPRPCASACASSRQPGLRNSRPVPGDRKPAWEATAMLRLDTPVSPGWPIKANYRSSEASYKSQPRRNRAD
jgi:dihydrofolate reductase